VDADVSIEALDGVFAHVYAAAESLQSPIDNPAGHLGADNLTIAAFAWRSFRSSRPSASEAIGLTSDCMSATSTPDRTGASPWTRW
jgi:hypothetical protein